MKYINITRNEFDYFHSAIEEKASLSEGADCDDYVEDARKSALALNRVIDRNNLKSGLKINRKVGVK